MILLVILMSHLGRIKEPSDLEKNSENGSVDVENSSDINDRNRL